MPYRYSTNTNPGHNKFYLVEWSETKGIWRRCWGRIGDEGTLKEHRVSDAKAAKKEAEKVFRQKISKGYIEQKDIPDTAKPKTPIDGTQERKVEKTNKAMFDGGRTLL